MLTRGHGAIMRFALPVSDSERDTSSIGARRLATNALQHLLCPNRARGVIFMLEVAIDIDASIQCLPHTRTQLRQLILAVIGAAEPVVTEWCGLNIRSGEFV